MSVSSRLDVALITCQSLPGVDADDQPLVEALERRGLAARPIAWNDAAADWSVPRVAVLRSTWDYFHDRKAFLAWAAEVAARSRLWNPEAVVRWNTHKGYLLELERKGCQVVPTALLPAGSPVDLAALMNERAWDEVVIKPAVSADSFETVRVSRTDIESGVRHLERLLSGRDMLVQPFLPSVEREGERCLVFIDGALSHAVRKRSHFLGGRHAGPEGVLVGIAPDERQLAQRAIEAAGRGSLLYARVDMARDESGRPVLMELELCEPTLFLREEPRAAERLAQAIAARL